MEPRSLFLPGADGVEIHALEWSREGVPFVLLHGFGNDAHIWDDLAPTLAPHYRTLAFDLRGHGDSGRDPEGRYDYDDHVRDLEAVLAGLGIDRLVLCGHSMGGRTSMLFAGGAPDRMAGLVIVDAGPELDPRGTTRIRMEIEERGSGDPSFASRGEYQRLLVHNYPAASPAIVERMALHGLREREDGRFELKTDPFYFSRRDGVTVEAMEKRERELTTRLWAALERVSCPTLVIRGAASDVLGPDCADRMVDDALAEGRLSVLPAGHSVMTDDPKGMIDAVSEFALGS